MTDLYIANEASGKYNTTFYTSYPPIEPYHYDIIRGCDVTLIKIIKSNKSFDGNDWAQINRHDNNMIGWVKLKNITLKSSIIDCHNQQMIKYNCKKLYDCYNPGYGPPKWSCEQPDIELMKMCKVFYDNGSNLQDVKQLVYQREPVNIGMIRCYSQNKLEEYFSWKHGYYGSCPSESHTLVPPNILVYTPCRVKDYPNVHILNAIGLAFDIQEQPDYIAYHKKSITNKDRHKFAINFYIQMFKKIFLATAKLGKKHIIMSLVGANNFAHSWSGGPPALQKNVWVPAYINSLKYKPDNIEVSTMGCKGSYPQTKLNLNDIGYFPACISKVNIEDTIFVNAWDCWSVPGNGNEQDNSLDGYIGRISDIGVNGTSLTNQWLANDVNYIPL